MKRVATVVATLVACQSPPAPAGAAAGQAASGGTSAIAASAPAANATTTAGTSASTSASASGKDGVRVVASAQDMDAASQIRTARLEAKGQGRVLVVYVAASWCEPCKKMKEEIQAGRLDSTLPKVTLLAFDADKDQERLASAGYTFRFVPYVAVPGADGQPVDSAEAHGKGPQAWRELLKKLEAWQR